MTDVKPVREQVSRGKWRAGGKVFPIIPIWAALQISHFAPVYPL